MSETQLFIIGLVALGVVFDIGVVISSGVDASISWTTFQWSKKYPIIPFAAGVLCGHLFFSQHGA